MNRALIISFLLIFCAAASALAIVDSNSTTNTSNPNDGSPWGNVGTVNGSSGVYLGSGWVLTANHVGAGNITFDIGSFTYDGTSVRLINPSDSSQTDLVLFHLTTTPNLPSLTLASSTPIATSAVDLMGYGRIRGSAQQNYVTTSGTYVGFDWSSSGAKSWGTNRIDSGGVFTQQDLGNGTLQVFSTTFDQSGVLRTTDESQAAVNDSGGAVFYDDSVKGWELAGIVDAIGTLTNQPANTAVYGDRTDAADIATYRSQIVSVVPEPSACFLLIAGAGGFFGVKTARKKSRRRKIRCV